MLNIFPDDTKVVKGGKNVRIDTFEEPGLGTVKGTSVSVQPGKTIEALAAELPHGQIRTTTVGDVRKAGGDVIPTRRSENHPYHGTITGLDEKEIECVLGDLIDNPNPKRK
jgi:hypothetical protein